MCTYPMQENLGSHFLPLCRSVNQWWKNIKVQSEKGLTVPAADAEGNIGLSSQNSTNFEAGCCWVFFFTLSHFPLEIIYLRLIFSLKFFPEQGRVNWSVILECFTRVDQNFISLLWPILRQSSRLFLKLNPKLLQGILQLNWQHCIRLQFSYWCQHGACQSPLAPAAFFCQKTAIYNYGSEEGCMIGVLVGHTGWKP